MNVLYGPRGERLQRREIVALSPIQLRAIEMFADMLAPLGLGMHCATCAKDVAGANVETQAVVSMTCGCREFKAANPRTVAH